MSFKDIKGQGKPIDMLRNNLESMSLPGAYLFTGEEGIGKRMAAVTLAKAINCLKETNDSCDSCVSCLKIDKHQHPDVHFIEEPDAGALKIESIRELKNNISLRPYEGKKKAFIIDNAHNLTAEAQNALLKILEEPPKDSLIILVTPKPALLFKTVISRCRKIKFYPLKRAQLEAVLTKDYALDNNLAHFLAYFSEGRIGRALKLKETDVLREKNRIIDEFNFSRNPALEGFLGQDREGAARCLNILVAWFRDIYLVKIGMSHYELINLDRKAQILNSMGSYDFPELDAILGSISDSLLYLRQNVNVKLLLSNLSGDINHGTDRTR